MKVSNLPSSFKPAQSNGMSAMLRRLAGRRGAQYLATGAMLMAAGQSSQAANQTWTGTTSADWEVTTNWSGGAVPGVINPAANALSADTATFNIGLVNGTRGGSTDPLIFANARNVKNILFDTNAGPYVFGTVGGNTLWLSHTGSVTMNATVQNAQTFNSPVQIRLPSSTPGTYSFVNNATNSAATLSFNTVQSGAASTRPLTLTLDGSNTGTNTINTLTRNGGQLINVVKQGTGTWILAGANDLAAGTTTISGGTLAIQNAGSLGTGTNTVGTGTLRLDNSITVAKNLTLNDGGGLASNNGANVWQGNVVVGAAVANGTFSAVGAGDTLTISTGTISGGQASSVMNIAGAGTVVLSTASTYQGGYSVNSGTLRLGNATALGAATSANVTFGAGSTGVLQLNGNSTIIVGLNTNATPGNVFVENGGSVSGANTLTVNNATANTFAGVLRDGSAGTLALTKGAAGVLTMTGANTYTGGTTITSGTLLINNASGSGTGSGAVAVSGTGVLGGSGTASGPVTVASGGHVAPGAAAGTVGNLTVGSLTLNSGSQLDYDITNASTLDQITVSGANGLTINGGQLNINGGTSAFTANGVYNLIGYTGAIGGTGTSALTVNAANQSIATNTYSFGTANNFVTLVVASSGATPDYWNVDADGNWSGPSNWTTGVPNAVGAFAALGGGGTAITANRTVTVDGSFTDGTLAFNNPTFAYTLAPGAGANITLDNGAQPSFVTDSAGNHFIQTPLTMTANGTTFSVSQAGDTLTDSGTIGGAGAALTKSGTGTLALTGSNTYTGGTNLNLGTIQINSAASLGDPAGNLAFGGGTLQLLADVTTARNYTVSGNSSAILDTNSHALTLNGAVAPASGGTGGLTKNGAGVLTLTGANTYTGATTVNGGTLSVSSNANLGDPTTAAGVTLNGGTLANTATMALDNGTNLRAVTLGASGGTVDTAPATTLTVAGTLTGSTALTKTDTGILQLNGNNASTFTGGTIITGGTVALGGGAANLNQGLGSGVVTFQGGTLNSNNFLGTDNGSTSYDINNAFVVATGQTGTINFAKRSSIGSALTGAGTLNLNLDGSRDVMNGNFSAFTGQLNLNVATGTGAGTTAEFRLNNGNGFGNAKMFLGSGVTVHQIFNPPSTGNVETVQNIGELSGVAGSVLSGNPVGGRFVNYTIGALGTNSTFAGLIADDAGGTRVTKVGAGTLTLTAANSYTGVTTINAGTLNINGVFALGGGNYAGLTFNGGALQYAAGFAGNGSGDISQDSEAAPVAKPVTINAGGATIDTNGNAVTYANTIGNNGAGGLKLNDTAVTKGTLTLSAAETYTGQTEVVAGALTLASGSSLASTVVKVDNPNGVLNVNSGAALSNATALTDDGTTNFANAAQQIGILNNNGIVTLNGTVLSVGSGTFGGSINDAAGGAAGSLIKNGVATLTLSGTNGYTGGTTVSTGTLALAGAANSAIGTGPIAVNGTSNSNVASATQGVLQLAADNQIANGVAVTLNGGTINTQAFSEGTPDIGTGPTAGMGALSLSNANGTFSFLDFGTSNAPDDASSTLAFSGFGATFDGQLRIVNYDYNNTGGVFDHFYLGATNTSSGTGLTPTQLSQITFVSPTGNGLSGDFTAIQLGNGEVVPFQQIAPTPEPGGLIPLMIGLAGTGVLIARRRRKANVENCQNELAEAV